MLEVLQTSHQDYLNPAQVIHSEYLDFIIKLYHTTHCSSQVATLLSITFLVGGGTAFSSSPAAGSIQAVAAGLVPAGLTPVAFFPPTNTQTLQALSVIFLEAPLKKRKRRSSFRGIIIFSIMTIHFTDS